MSRRVVHDETSGDSRTASRPAPPVAPEPEAAPSVARSRGFAITAGVVIAVAMIGFTIAVLTGGSPEPGPTTANTHGGFVDDGPKAVTNIIFSERAADGSVRVSWTPVGDPDSFYVLVGTNPTRNETTTPAFVIPNAPTGEVCVTVVAQKSGQADSPVTRGCSQ